MRTPRPALRLALALALAGGRSLASAPLDPTTPDPHVARDAFISDRRGLMTLLGGWSLGSIVTGSAMWSSSSDALVRYAGVQNLAWGVIDGAIAGYALYAAREDAHADEPLTHWTTERAHMRRIFWINVALDVAYLAAGAALLGFGTKESVRGSGAGVLAQGGFLLVFDAAGAIVLGP
jgi:hypothetical protein